MSYGSCHNVQKMPFHDILYAWVPKEPAQSDIFIYEHINYLAPNIEIDLYLGTKDTDFLHHWMLFHCDTSYQLFLPFAESFLGKQVRVQSV